MMTAVKEKFLNPLFVRRAAFCLPGNFVLAIGVAVTVKADMGITPVNSIAFVLSRDMNKKVIVLTFVMPSSGK
ncbi:MAG: hypothetical protein LBB81_04415 [Treponema sp.]|jgi:uncharacterized membrane protein YczE|nr:hypothetical protein [Treponema sp.]